MGGAVAGVLHKWTNFGKGWRPRWFVLRGSVLTYSRIHRRNPASSVGEKDVGGAPRLIGDAAFWTPWDGNGGEQPLGVVHLKISSFRESKSDERRFYIITPTKTLQLRTDSAKDRVAWIEALVSARSESAAADDGNSSPFGLPELPFSTDKLRSRLQAEGLGESVIQECEQIVLSEFSQRCSQLRLRYEEYLSFVGNFPQQLEEFNAEDLTATIGGGRRRSISRDEFISDNGKCSGECSNTESSEDVEKVAMEDDLLDEDDEDGDDEEDEPCFFESKQSFSDRTVPSSPETAPRSISDNMNGRPSHKTLRRRTRLPDPMEKEKGISLWSLIKDNVGKDLTRVCLPVYFNEPLSSLQKCFEDLEYSHLLDQAYEHGKSGNGLMRALCVAAFAVSSYASSDGRLCKPFNPLLGETYEADYPEKGIRFFSEKVSHHPMIMACHCEGRGWRFWGDSDLKSKFWGQSIQLNPEGMLMLEFDDGETFQWSKITSTIYNLIIGKVYCNHHGTMDIRGNRNYSCKLKFKEYSMLERNPRQVQGFVYDAASGAKLASLTGKWDDRMCYTIGNGENGSTLLWRRAEPPTNPTRYNLTSFAITMNEMTPELQERLPPTDSRRRPDQRHLENGEYEKANAEKLRLEKRQRMSRKMQESGWRPRWFRRDSESGTYRYVGGYWEARERRRWTGCPDIFGEFASDAS